MIVAALFVATGGAYFNLDGVDPWDVVRDARAYAGPHPVVAHPPCERWGRYWSGGPSANTRRGLGDDGGCFTAALAAARRWGGVIEHPEASHAWRAHGLIAPLRGGGWSVADDVGGWTCCVEQGHYGHRARKATWLYAIGVDIPVLKWGRSSSVLRTDYGFHSAEERRRFARPPAGMSQEERDRRREWLGWYAEQTGKEWAAPERMGKPERLATPIPFRDLLIGIARSAYDKRAEAFG